MTAVFILSKTKRKRAFQREKEKEPTRRRRSNSRMELIVRIHHDLVRVLLVDDRDSPSRI